MDDILINTVQTNMAVIQHDVNNIEDYITKDCNIWKQGKNESCLNDSYANLGFILTVLVRK